MMSVCGEKKKRNQAVHNKASTMADYRRGDCVLIIEGPYKNQLCGTFVSYADDGSALVRVKREDGQPRLLNLTSIAAWPGSNTGSSFASSFAICYAAIWGSNVPAVSRHAARWASIQEMTPPAFVSRGHMDYHDNKDNEPN